MEVAIAVAKVPKFGLSESGDSVEVVERPRGGLTAIMADGQTHGRAAKRVSQFVVAKAIGLIADGVRDGAVARGVHDALFAARDGKVSTELTMITVDFRTKSLVISRNSHVPVFLRHPSGEVERLESYVEPIGVHEVMRPMITELPMESGLIALAMTDGIYSAGTRYGAPLNPDDVVAMLATTPPERVQELVDGLLEKAMELDRRRPADDMAVMAVGLAPKENVEVRRLAIRVPI
ncbi:MAG TPA: SpoIIE family protein phosphatase [Symbiobacteriaceae bacterium]|nr:SpoIIE family protein phosphatase [Symbiobacteriaceae bacterium]